MPPTTAGAVAALCALSLVAYVAISGSAPGDDATSFDAIIVLAGGVSDEGRPHETVMRRLREAASVYHAQVTRTGAAPSIICNGGGTTHKPKWVDAAGYAVPEAALMAKELTSLGVKGSDIYTEGYSDDTIGQRPRRHEPDPPALVLGLTGSPSALRR